MRNKKNVNNILSKENEKQRIIEDARRLGIASETKIRNLKIRGEYKLLRRQHRCKEALYILADKYFLDYKTIQTAVYQKNNEQ